MDREQFLARLKWLLSDLSEEEQEEALEYYRDYFDEAGPEHEQEAIAHFGSPEKVAAEIRAGLSGDQEAGEFTETGYRDERFEEKPHTPDQYGALMRVHGSHGKSGYSANREGAECTAKNRDKSRGGILTLLLFFFFGLPLAGSIIGAGFSAVAAIIGTIFGIFGGLIGLAVGGVAWVIGMFAAGIGLMITGACNMASPAIGLMLIGGGFFALAVGLLGVLFVRWCCGVAVPSVFRLTGTLIRTMCNWIRNLLRRIFRGGNRT